MCAASRAAGLRRPISHGAEQPQADAAFETALRDAAQQIQRKAKAAHEGEMKLEIDADIARLQAEFARVEAAQGRFLRGETGEATVKHGANGGYSADAASRC